jgi:RNA polymerase sigma factor (TIGR02999 family)
MIAQNFSREGKQCQTGRCGQILPPNVQTASVEFCSVFLYPSGIDPRSSTALESEVDTPSCKQITEILLRRRNADPKALEAILPLVYDELRKLARYHLRQQRPNHTLQTTALVHEAYLRLAQEKSLAVENRFHLLSIAAQLMRWILVDYERARRAAKRGSGVTRLTLDANVDVPQAANPDVDLLALDEALERLAKLDPQQSEIIELRYFGGLSIEDTAEVLGISPATVKRSWSSARAWLLREIGRAELDK